MSVKEKLIVALDVDDSKKAEALINALSPSVKIFKVGSRLFTGCGPDIIKAIHGKGGKVFLDLKYHDIPETVSKAVTAAARHGVFMLTVHTLGGPDMLRRAVQSARSRGRALDTRRPKIIGVTILTSMDGKDLKSIGVRRGLKKEVICLAALAKKLGLDGVVASAGEIAQIRKAAGGNFTIITPGIRPEGSFGADQKRTATPAEAIRKGADYIVVGRPITDARDPGEAAENILREMEDAYKRSDT